MKAALIGYGYWGKILDRYLQESSFFTLSKICSAELDKKGIFTNDLNEVVEDAALEAVFICTPTSTHFEICKTMLESGKHVFCEKPTVKNPDEYRVLSAIADRRGKILYTDYLYMVSPGINQVKKMLPMIGRLKHLDCVIRQFGQFYPSDDVYEIIGVHMLSAILFLTEDQWTEVCFQDHMGRIPCECGTVYLTFSKGTTATVSCSLLAPEKERTIHLYGENGSLLFDMRGQPTVKLTQYDSSNPKHPVVQEKKWDFDEGNSLGLSLLEFERCIETGNDRKNKTIAVDILEICVRSDYLRDELS